MNSLLLKGALQINLPFLALIGKEFEGSGETETELSEVSPHRHNETWTPILTTALTSSPSVEMFCAEAQRTFLLLRSCCK